MKIVRVLSVSLLIFGVSLGSQEARGCDLCGFEECWFEPDVVVSLAVGLHPHTEVRSVLLLVLG